RVRASAEAAVDAVDDPLEKVRALIAGHVEAMLTDIDMNATMLLERRSLTAERDEELRALRQDYEDFVRRLVANAQSAGQIRDDLSAGDLTLAMMNLLNWTITWYQPDGRLEIPGVVDLLASLFLDGAAQTK